jgi:hypothetical protein
LFSLHNPQSTIIRRVIMNIQKSLPPPRLKASLRKTFLDHLSATANVSASARQIEMGTASIYAERRRSADFRAGWTIALAEGYARLEAEMLHDALTKASGNTNDSTIKARAQKDRLRLALLAMHRASVKTAGNGAPAILAQNAENPKANILAKLFKMRSAAHRKAAAQATAPVPESDHG